MKPEKPLVTVRKSHHRLERPPFECVALVLQGGGALGAFQAGVYQALAEARLLPDWVAGISIGAINAALIVGNPPETCLDQLRQFWERVSAPVVPEIGDLAKNLFTGDIARGFLNQMHAAGALMSGAPGFFTPRPVAPFFYPAGTIEATSYYDTAMLRSTLEELVDFDRINNGPTRLSIGAVNVRTGNFVYFDSNTHTIRPQHVMASGALPPGFPPVEIEGELYWDGGLVSNTPLQWVVSGDTRLDTLAFQVDLWSARGEAPRDIPDVMSRQKEIQYSSRTRANTDQFRKIQTVRATLANVLEKLPPAMLDEEDIAILRAVADRKVYKIVHLIYRSRHYERQSKDYEFSRLSMQEHWQAGYNDAVRTLRHPEALMRPGDRSGFATFDIGVDGRD
ncbi:MAG: patatin-like phospholipase family protein [Hyphomicrobiales bacterium]|nr:patatin-like phospholipase family protein [Hyphomicrobiales bacterium]